MLAVTAQPAWAVGTLSVADAQVVEGTGGVTTLEFVVTLSTVNALPVTVDYQTNNGTAVAPDDFTAATGQLTIPAGETEGIIPITIVTDTAQEPDETFGINLSNPSVGTTTTQGSAVGTILNDDSAISVADVSVAEGTGGTSIMNFEVSLVPTNALAVNVDYATSNGTATAPGDYTATSGTTTIPAGQSSVLVPVTITTDSFAEGNETLTLTLSNPPAGIPIGDGTATGTITNDDGLPPSLVVNDPTANETDVSGTVDFAISLPGPAVQTVTVAYTTASGTAVSGTDFTPAAGTATIAAGASSTTVPVAITGDDLDEADETFSLNLSNASNAAIGDPTGTATIIDDDATPSVAADAPSTPETNGPTTLTFTVALDAPSGRTVTVDFATSDGTATAGADYTAESGTLIFAPGETSKTVVVDVAGDTIDEVDETVLLTLSNPVNALLPQATTAGTIVDDEAEPGMTITDLDFAEGDAGTATALITVSLSVASGRTVTVDAATGTGTATAGTDYQAASATLSFPVGTTTRTLSVPVLGDVFDEDDETIPVTLTNASGATLVDPSGVLTITDDDATPSLTISNANVAEGDSGTVPATLTVTLSAASGRDVSVSVATTSGTATEGFDFAAQTGTTVNIPAGSTTANVSASVFGDLVDEANETFDLTLSGPNNATIADGAGTITILDDDIGPSISIGDTEGLEGTPPPSTDTTFTFTVTLSTASEQIVTVNYATADATAVAGASGDYDAASGTVTFTPGQTTRPITVEVNRDSHPETPETFLVNLSSPTNATLSGDATGIGTINNDDGPAPTLSIADVTVAEAAGTATLTVTLSSAATQDTPVDVTTSNGTAVAPGDYTALTTTVTVLTGQTSATTAVTIIDDESDEPNESFTATLSNARNATISDGTATVTITDNDEAPTVSVADASVAEGDTGMVTVSLSAPAGQTITVQATTADGTATAADYTSGSTQVSFASGESTKQVSVVTLEDTFDEADETVSITLSNPTSGATIDDGTGVLTITDDDATPSLSVDDAAVSEGETGSVTISLSGPSYQAITVHAATSDGTATAADYTAVSTDVTFDPGQTSKQVSIATIEDNIDELDETVTVTLSDPTAGSTITDGTAVLTITDDDATPTISIGNASVTEGDSGSTPAGFAVTLSRPSSRTITVQASTAHDTTNSLDLTSFSNSVVTFVPGDTSETVNVQVTGDSAPEANETFTVTLANPTEATIADGSGAGTITDDDAAGTYNPVTPARVLDTRIGLGRPGTSKVTGGQTVTLDVTGVGGVPASGVSAVALNVTVTGPTGSGFVSVTPEGGNSTSNLNYASGEVVANLVIVPVGPDGNVKLFTNRTTHLVGDVFGWFANDTVTSPGSHFTSLTPARVLDTRTGQGVPGGAPGPLPAGTNRVLDVTGVGGVPSSGVSAVILNVTITTPTANSHLSVTPTGGTSTSNINFVQGETVAGHVIVPVDESGVVRYAVGGGTTHVVADVFGWFSTPATLTGSVLTTVAPARLADTRPNPDDRLGPDEYGVLPIAGEGGVPVEGAAAAVLNLTVTQPTGSSYLTVSLDGEEGTSNINFAKNQTVANLAVVPINQTYGDVIIYNKAGFVHVIVDVFAWFSTPAP